MAVQTGICRRMKYGPPYSILSWIFIYVFFFIQRESMQPLGRGLNPSPPGVLLSANHSPPASPQAESPIVSSPSSYPASPLTPEQPPSPLSLPSTPEKPKIAWDAMKVLDKDLCTFLMALLSLHFL
jgi:hypothetical protein